MINLSQSKGFSSHRHGWSYALSGLSRYNSLSGIFVDDFIERTFSWDLPNSYRNKLPYRFPWVGFLHNPPNMPHWFDYNHSPQSIFQRDVFKESLRSCKCIVVLSDYLKHWVEQELSVPVVMVKHPTGIAPQWNMESFVRSESKKVVQLGYWLRKIDSIARLNLPRGYIKRWMPSVKNKAKQYLDMLASVNGEYHSVKNTIWRNIEVLDFLSDSDYDTELASSIVFIDLYDSSANNGIIECISRNTPIVVNNHPAAIEYLGKDYPLYFNSLEEAEYKLSNMSLICDAHVYLKNMDKTWISNDFFAVDLIEKLKEVI